MMIAALQQGKKQQRGHFGNPSPARLPVDQLKNQQRKPGKQEISDPGKMANTDMRHYVTVKVEQDKNKREGQVGKAEFLTNFSQSPETKRVKQKHLKEDELINIQKTQQQELRRDKSIGDSQVTLRVKYAELHRCGSMQR